MKTCSNTLKLHQYLRLLGTLLAIFASAAASQAAGLSAAHHIQIELIPAEMKLNGRDEISITSNGREFLQFRISERASQLKVDVDENPVPFNTRRKTCSSEVGS